VLFLYHQPKIRKATKTKKEDSGANSFDKKRVGGGEKKRTLQRNILVISQEQMDNPARRRWPRKWKQRKSHDQRRASSKSNQVFAQLKD